MTTEPDAYPLVDTFDDGPLHVDFDHMEVTIDGTPVALTPVEFRVLATLVRHQGQVLSAEQLSELATIGLTPQRVNYVVMRVRQKLGWYEFDRTGIETVRGRGYRYRNGPGRSPNP
jgi:two-component system, OmpR family, response regulator